MEAGDLESPLDLSFDIVGEPPADLAEGVEIEADFDAPAPVFDVPGKPTAGKVTATGLVIKATWGPAPPGAAGGPTNYLVYCSCTGKMEKVGNLTRVMSWTAKGPGTYTGFIAAQNSKGSGPTWNFKITVTSSDGAYKGAFGGTGTITRTVGSLTCRWQITYKGTIALSLTQGASGLTGRMILNGTSSSPPGVPVRGNVNCLPGSNSYGNTTPVIISGTNIARTGLAMGVSVGTFSGNLAGNKVTGTLKAVYKNGPGTLVMAANLTK